MSRCIFLFLLDAVIQLRWTISCRGRKDQNTMVFAVKTVVGDQPRDYKTPNEIKKKKKKNVEIKKDKETKRNEYIEVTKNECVVPNEFERMVERNGNRNCARAVKTCDEYTR